ncbi:MAG: hypothetical protein SFH39_08115 [Candidatus Magnetobacterium sp. LHC-1]|nr:hypothetical protein [Nitrospirota bacterium]
MFLKKELFKEYLKSVGMMPDSVLGGREKETQELTEDDFKKHNIEFKNKCQIIEKKITTRVTWLICAFFFICLLFMYFLFTNSSQVRDIKPIIGLIIPICFMIMKLHKEATTFQLIVLIMESPTPQKAAKIISDLFPKMFYTKQLSKTKKKESKCRYVVITTHQNKTK